MNSYDIIGFTGTSKGMTLKQRFLLEDILHQHFPLWVHLGDCVGADAQAHLICVILGLKTVGHPPVNGAKRAFCKYNQEFPPKEYLDRNHDIVDASKLLLACPHGYVEEQRSGTWATIRYARKCGKPHIIIWPDGERYAEWR